MTNIFKKIYYWIIPKEYKQEASDLTYTIMNRNGKQCTVNVKTPKPHEKDEYFREPMELPDSLQKKVQGYHYEANKNPELLEIEKDE